MTSTVTRFLWATFCLFLLFGNAGPAAASPFDEQDLKVKLRTGETGMLRDLRVALGDRARVVAFLDRLGAPGDRNLKRRLTRFLDRPGNRLRGLGGIQARTALRASDLTLTNRGGFAGQLEPAVVKGQIMQEVDGEPGFLYQSGRPMHVWVKMTSTFQRGRRGRTVTIEEMFRVEIPHAALTPEEANASNGFPGFAAAAFPVSVPGDRPNLRWKLWAVGTDIKVTEYRIRRDDRFWWTFTPTSNNQRFASIFEPDPDACFDMLFEIDPRTLPGGTLPADWAPPHYCLGRCKNPPIVNTR